MSKNIKKELKENENIKQESDYIEEIINNSLLDDAENIEEEDDEEEEEIEERNYSDKNKNIKESEKSNIVNNVNNNDISQDKYKQYLMYNYEDVIDKLLIIDLFEYHFNEKYQLGEKLLTNKIVKSKYLIEYFCSKYNPHFSKYVICILEKKIYELINYVSGFINKMKEKKTLSIGDIFKIKNSLDLTGKDVSKVFEMAFQKTKSFDVSSIMIVLFITNILSGSISEKMSDEEYEQIIKVDSLEEKDQFEKYVKECKIFLSTLEEDIMFKENKEKDDKNEKNDKNNSEIEESTKKPDKKIENENIKEKKIINKNRNSKNNSKNNIDSKNKDKKNNQEKPENYSDLEELMEYINGSDNKKKKKKKRKKKSKVKNNNEKTENIIIEKDIVFENFKSNLISFSNNLKKFKKIKPNISDAFIAKLSL